MARKASTGSEARRRADRLRALRASPEQLREHVLAVLADEANPDILTAALGALGANVRPADGPLLRDTYGYFDEQGPRRDPGGGVRVEILRVLWHLRSRDDLDLALKAARTRERTLNGNGEMVRAAGLALLGALDPDAGAFEAALMLGTDEASPMNGEPLLTAVRLLANLGETRLLLFFVGAFWRAHPEVRAEAIRSLAPVPISYLAPLLPKLMETDDDVVLLGVGDLVTELPSSPETSEAVRSLLRSRIGPEVYAFLTSAIVASRRQDLIGALLETLPAEMLQARLRAAVEALQLAPRTKEVEAALRQLAARLTAVP